MQDTSEHRGGFSVSRSVLSACCGYLFCGILLLAGAGAIYKGLIPEHWMYIVCWCAVVISALLVAFFAAGKGGHRIAGSLCAGLLFYLFSLITGQVIGGAVDSGRIVIMGAVVLVDCMIGAVLSGLIRG